MHTFSSFKVFADPAFGSIVDAILLGRVVMRNSNDDLEMQLALTCEKVSRSPNKFHSGEHLKWIAESQTSESEALGLAQGGGSTLKAEALIRIWTKGFRAKRQYLRSLVNHEMSINFKYRFCG